MSVIKHRPNSVASSALADVACKWSPSVLQHLRDGSRRYCELRARIDGVSEKMLTQTLRVMERNGLVRRARFPVVPPHVVYSLTTLGRQCSDHVVALTAWLEHNAELVGRAREDYDALAESERRSVVWRRTPTELRTPFIGAQSAITYSAQPCRPTMAPQSAICVET